MEAFLLNTNIWFYALSTSAQVIAAIYGLTAVFVVYKIQTIEPAYSEVKNALRKITTGFNSKYGDHNNLDDILKLDTDQQVVDSFKDALERSEKGESGSRLNMSTSFGRLNLEEATIGLFQSFLDKRSFVFLKFKQISFISVFSILFCLILLTFFEPSICTYGYFVVCMVGVFISVAGSAVSVFEILKK